MNCRHCKSELKLSLADLGSAPPSNAFLTSDALQIPEKRFPLRVLVCEKCWLVQTEDFADPKELFDANYAYFSSVSRDWLEHCERYVADMTARFHLSSDSHVVEVAANDGYLLQFVKAHGIPCTGIEPTASTAKAARAKGIEVIEDFFGVALAKVMMEQGKQADLTIANNVLAHVPDINDFVAGFKLLMKPEGIATFEFPHLLKMVQGRQFDTIYHEHFSYLSLTVVSKIFEQNGLSVFDAEELPTHGGSLRVYAERSDTGKHPVSDRVHTLAETEKKLGVATADFYRGFQAKADCIKNDFRTFLVDVKNKGKKVAAYGAAAKGNTLLNYADVKEDLLPFVCDAAPTKQGKFLPGSRIPIVAEERIREQKPDYVLVLPWNIKDEIKTQLSYIRDWGGRFVTAVPQLEVV